MQGTSGGLETHERLIRVKSQKNKVLQDRHIFMMPFCFCSLEHSNEINFATKFLTCSIHKQT